MYFCTSNWLIGWSLVDKHVMCVYSTDGRRRGGLLYILDTVISDRLYIPQITVIVDRFFIVYKLNLVSISFIKDLVLDCTCTTHYSRILCVWLSKPERHSFLFFFFWEEWWWGGGLVIMKPHFDHLAVLITLGLTSSSFSSDSSAL